MGCGFSSPSSSSGSLPPLGEGSVRVIHTNGYVEDFHGPGAVTVSRVTGCANDDPGGPPRYVLCSAAHLLQPGRGAFRPDDALQPGTVYFLLPHSVFQSEASPVDLACLMNRLTALARKGCAASAASPLDAFLPPDNNRRHVVVDPAAAVPAPKEMREPPARPAPWRPCLDRIDESVGRASMRSSASTRSACSSEA